MNKRTIMLVAILTVMTASLTGCFYHKPEFTGQVLDKETKQPIEGAVVVAVYKKEMLGLLGGGSLSKTINVRETLTDKKGVFVIPSYTTIITPLAWSKKAGFIIFKPGYGTIPEPDPIDQEVFFSEDYGKEREIETWRKSESNGPELYKPKVVYGVVELPKLRTKREMLERGLGFPVGYGVKDLPLLYRAYKDELNRFEYWK